MAFRSLRSWRDFARECFCLGRKAAEREWRSRERTDEESSWRSSRIPSRASPEYGGSAARPLTNAASSQKERIVQNISLALSIPDIQQIRAINITKNACAWGGRVIDFRRGALYDRFYLFFATFLPVATLESNLDEISYKFQGPFGWLQFSKTLFILSSRTDFQGASEPYK